MKRCVYWTVPMFALLMVLFDARDAHAGYMGYPCRIAYEPSVALGDTMEITLYSEPYCSGSYVGSPTFFGQPVAGGCGYGLPTSWLVPAESLRTMYTNAMNNYWKRTYINTLTYYTPICSYGTIGGVANELQSYSN